MNYLTNYYKNLCEELEARIISLSNKINLLEDDNVDADAPWLPDFLKKNPPKEGPIQDPTQIGPPAPIKSPTPTSQPKPPKDPFQGSDGKPPAKPNRNLFPRQGTSDPGYQKMYERYYLWHQSQPLDWQRAHPWGQPPFNFTAPSQPASVDTPRRGGGYYPGSAGN
jgi:hypothetical protein